MSIGSTKKIESTTSAPSKAKSLLRATTGGQQFVENIDTTNNVLVRDESEQQERGSSFEQRQNRSQLPEFKSATADISTSLEALTLSGALENDGESSGVNIANSKVSVYNNNQSIIKDEEVERTGRSYLKHFYEKNEHIIDVDEFV